MLRYHLAATALLPVFLVGCASVQLSEAGQRIQIVSQQAVDNCTFVAPVTSRIGSNFKSYETNVELAMNEIRNQAALRVATNAVVNPPHADSEGALSGLSSSSCQNCVTLTGNAFICSRASAQSVSAPTIPSPTDDGTAKATETPVPSQGTGRIVIDEQNSASSAEPALKAWKGRHVRITMKDGRTLTGVISSARTLRLYLVDGGIYNLEEMREIVLTP